MSFGPSTSLTPPGVSLPTSLLLARSRRATVEYVESKWRGIGCRYFGAFVLSTAFRTVNNTFNKFVALEHGRIPENINLLLKLGAPKIPMTTASIPRIFVEGSDFYRDIYALIVKQFDALRTQTVVHYYAYNKVYQRYSTRTHDYDAYIISHVQQHIANGFYGNAVNSYSNIAISEQGDPPRCIYQTLQGPMGKVDSARVPPESALGLEWRI